jgi:cytidylate kinase
MQKLLWAGSSSVIKKISGSDTFDNIPAGVWELHLSMMGPYLQKVSDNFHFGHKIYGLEEDFIDYTLRSFDVAEKNLGILLNGLKGCGKTVTAKIIANRTELPVILVNSSNIDALDYFNDITQSLCFIFDEFEKIVDHKNQERIAPLLSFVDGTVTVAKHMMIFTSNDTNISEFFIDRPGRIRYIKNYGSLSIETVREILNERLIHKEFKQEIVEWVMFFKFLTIDILMSVINEVNIHKVGPSAFKTIFNANNDKPSYDVIYKLTHPVTNQTVEFEHDQSINYAPADFFEDLIDHDSSVRILGHSGHADIATNEIVSISESYARSMYLDHVDHVKEELEDNVYKCLVGFNVRRERPSHDFIKAQKSLSEEKSAKPEEQYKKIIATADRTGFIEENVIYNCEITFKARPLYRNQSYVF